ncbi:hypothetical protein M758_UG007200 [Ceratodon purpureus]|nr:hypothetical protein M758_UG007200 [Ceratodon purpureus]
MRCAWAAEHSDCALGGGSPRPACLRPTTKILGSVKTKMKAESMDSAAALTTLYNNYKKKPCGLDRGSPRSLVGACSHSPPRGSLPLPGFP